MILSKMARNIYKRTLDIEFEQYRSIGLGSTIGDGHTHTHTHTHTHRHLFLNTFLDCGSDVETKIKKVEVEFFDDCNTSFTPYVPRK